METFHLISRRLKTGRIVLELQCCDRTVVVFSRPINPGNEVGQLVLDVVEHAYMLTRAEDCGLRLSGDKGQYLDTIGHYADTVVHLTHADGLRVALACVLRALDARPAQRRAAVANVAELPAEVALYHFTGCYYGRRTKAHRAAFRALVTTAND